MNLRLRSIGKPAASSAHRKRNSQWVSGPDQGDGRLGPERADRAKGLRSLPAALDSLLAKRSRGFILWFGSFSHWRTPVVPAMFAL